jgi:hypothetical protein
MELTMKNKKFYEALKHLTKIRVDEAIMRLPRDAEVNDCTVEYFKNPDYEKFISADQFIKVPPKAEKT